MTRISCYLLYFAVYLGLEDLLAHWRAERVFRLPPGMTNTSNFYYWDPEQQEAKSLPLVSVFRVLTSSGDQHTPDRPSYTLYTIFTLEEAYLNFWLMTLIHMYLIVMVKLTTSPQFRLAPRTSMLKEAVEGVTVVEAHKDWDLGGGSVEEHMRRWWQVVREVTSLSILHLASNILLVLPLIFTGEQPPFQ